jgi:hypothetical protein
MFHQWCRITGSETVRHTTDTSISQFRLLISAKINNITKYLTCISKVSASYKDISNLFQSEDKVKDLLPWKTKAFRTSSYKKC